MSKYPPEFHEQIVELYRKGGRTYADIGREFGISATTVTNWVRKVESTEGRPLPMAADDKQEIARLRRELKQKSEELEILGKALAFFVRQAEQ